MLQGGDSSSNSLPEKWVSAVLQPLCGRRINSLPRVSPNEWHLNGRTEHAAIRTIFPQRRRARKG